MGNSIKQQHSDDARGSEPDIAPSTLMGASHIIRRAEPVLEALRQYKGADDLIREACKDPNDEDAALSAADRVTANMQNIMQFYEFSNDIAGIARDLSTKAIKLDTASDDSEIIGSLILFCFDFDQLKNERPSMQNDSSYYRRVLSHSNTSNVASLGAVADRNSGLVTADNAHLAAMWLAQPCSMMSSLASVPGDVLCRLGDICQAKISEIPRTDKINSLRWLRIWAAIIILYDRNTPAPGAFTKNSPIKIKHAVDAIHRRAMSCDIEHLLNCIKFGSLNYNSPATTKGIHRAFDRGSNNGILGGWFG